MRYASGSVGCAGSGGQVIALPAGTASLRRRLLSNYVRTPPAIRHTEQQFLSDIQEIELPAPGRHISLASHYFAQSKCNFLTNISILGENHNIYLRSPFFFF